MENERWLLPEGIEEVLPVEAARLETWRRRLLDLFATWGYELVMPPLIEYLESLSTGTGNDLALQTFKLTDQLTGRLMGVRADMTPQVARIDNHQLKRELPTRLCYLGTVLHTRPQALGGTRSPLQIGAELYGHMGVESDFEVLALMVETLQQVGLNRIHVDLGHVGIYRALARQAGLDPEAERVLFEALQRKAKPEIEAFLAARPMGAQVKDMLVRLADLHGGEEVLSEAQRVLAGASDEVHAALDNLRELAAAAATLTDIDLHFDLAELRGYHYHTGAVFSAFVPGQGQAIAQGGRYDDVGRVFGRARPATGFSTDLKALLAFVSDKSSPLRGIFAPAVQDPALEGRIRELRNDGERVVRALSGQNGIATDMGCDRVLVQSGGMWQVVSAT